MDGRATENQRTRWEPGGVDVHTWEALACLPHKRSLEEHPRNTMKRKEPDRDNKEHWSNDILHK